MGEDRGGRTQREQSLWELCYAIDFSNLPLLNDTVTELYISTDKNDGAQKLSLVSTLPSVHPYATKSDNLWFSVREDPAQIRYPSYTGVSTRQINLLEVCPIEKLSTGVSTAPISFYKEIYVLKHIERKLYMPQDSEALEKELHVLEKVGAQNNIVKLVASIVSENPYCTAAVPNKNLQ